MGKLNSLQVLRFVAAAMVVHLHATNMCFEAGLGTGWAKHQFAVLGAAGVDIFFVISGAIIYHTAFERRLPAGEFLRRRCIRVAPIYWLLTLLWLPIGLLIIGERYTVGNTIATVAFWPAWGDMIQHPIIMVGWTLCFEMLFYTGAAMLLRWPRMIWALMAAYPLAWIGREITGAPALRFLGNPMVLEFCLGVAVMRYRRWITPGVAGALLVVGVIWLTLPYRPLAIYDAMRVISGDAALLRVGDFGLPAALIVAGFLGLERFFAGRWSNVPVYLGEASYSLYLTHALAALAFVPAVRAINQPAALVVPVAMLLAIALGCLVYEGLEKPLLAALRPRLTARRA